MSPLRIRTSTSLVAAFALVAACASDVPTPPEAQPDAAGPPSPTRGGEPEPPAKGVPDAAVPDAGQPAVPPADAGRDARPESDARPEPEPDPVLVGAGDIALCGGDEDEKTAALLDTLPGTVFVAGDNAYTNGSAREYTNCYAPSWGRHKARTRPAAGNHEYQTPNAAGYFGYFGASAGDPARGYYSYDLGAWHVVVLNSNCDEIGGCSAGSTQETWLRRDLTQNPRACTLAYWHHPRYSSGAHGDATSMRPLWQALYDLGADLVLTGHDHDYERFAPQDANSNLDRARGIVEFVVGTGGAALRPFGATRANSVVRNAQTHGVLELTLRASSADFRFVPIAGQTFTDRGTVTCH